MGVLMPLNQRASTYWQSQLASAVILFSLRCSISSDILVTAVWNSVRITVSRTKTQAKPATTWVTKNVPQQWMTPLKQRQPQKNNSIAIILKPESFWVPPRVHFENGGKINGLKSRWSFFPTRPDSWVSCRRTSSSRCRRTWTAWRTPGPNVLKLFTAVNY